MTLLSSEKFCLSILTSSSTRFCHFPKFLVQNVTQLNEKQQQQRVENMRWFLLH